jgi:hypothetical protein
MCWDDNARELVLSTDFDLIIAAFPPPGPPSMGSFLQAVRAEASPCRHSGLLLLADSRSVLRATGFIGRGANRVVSEQDSPEHIASSAADLLKVAPRLPIRVPTRIDVKLFEQPVTNLCQTENLSASGMLLRGFGHYPVGTALDFELDLPGDAAPIRGGAEVARITDPSRERLTGFAARFVSFLDEDRSRLEIFLGQRLH